MKVHIIFDGIERREFVTTDVPDGPFTPRQIELVVKKMLHNIEEAIFPKQFGIVGTLPKSQTPA